MTATQAPTPGPLSGSVEGRLAAKPWRAGDPLPAVGSAVLVSGANCDVDSDQHRAFMWRTVVGYGDQDRFVCLQTGSCWPTVERLENCWFAEIPTPRLAPTAPVEASGSERGSGRVGKFFKNARIAREVTDEENQPPRPQPSGETREAVARLAKDVATVKSFSANIATFYDGPDKRYIRDVAADIETALALLSARPLALGGQK